MREVAHPGSLRILKEIVSVLTQNNAQVMWDNLCIKFINHQCEGDWLRWVCEVIIFSWLFLAKRAKENMLENAPSRIPWKSERGCVCVDRQQCPGYLGPFMTNKIEPRKI